MDFTHQTTKELVFLAHKDAKIAIKMDVNNVLKNQARTSQKRAN